MTLIARDAAGAGAPALATPGVLARWRIASRFALRELRGGVRGFGVFLACIALGVAAISGVGSFSRALTDGLAREGMNLLGGDAAFTLVQREASPAEYALLSAGGKVSTVATLRAMARAGEGDSLVATLTEAKAVDSLYPLAGAMVLDPDVPLAQALAVKDGVYGAAADPILAERLNLKPGDLFRIGDARLRLDALIEKEPDSLATGLGFGPRVLISRDALDASHLLQPGSLVRWHYRVKLDDPSGLQPFLDRVKAGAPDAGFEVRTRDAATPRLEDSVRRFTQYLTLVGLTALLVGGVGVANAVKSHLDARRGVIAVYKSLGAPGGMVFLIYLIEIGLIAAVGIGIGLAVGVALTVDALSTGGSLADITGAGRSRSTVNTVTSTASAATIASPMAPARPGSARSLAAQPRSGDPSGSHRGSSEFWSSSAASADDAGPAPSGSTSGSAPSRRCRRAPGSSGCMRRP
jgi:putative ABC transport system permease protein